MQKKQIKLTTEVQDWICKLIAHGSSPEQVSNYLERHRGLKLHHETICQFIYREKDNGGELHKHLRIANKPYRKRYGKYD